jgi:hypothetical protein
LRNANGLALMAGNVLVMAGGDAALAGRIREVQLAAESREPRLRRGVAALAFRRGRPHALDRCVGSPHFLRRQLRVAERCGHLGNRGFIGMRTEPEL